MPVLNMNATDCGLTTDAIFLRAPRLNKEDISEPLSDDDIKVVDEFEDKWKEFLRSRPGILPPGQKVKSFRNIQTQVNEIEGKKQNVCMELQRQLDFFANSRDKLEETYKKFNEDATLRQNGLVEGLEREIDNIALADQVLSEVLPWEHFFDNVESNTSTANNGFVASRDTRNDQNQITHPSDEALYLANVQQSEVVSAARRGKSHGALLRAHRIDNGLLKAKVAMMKREVDRMEKTINSDRILSNFLMKNDVWGAMASSKK